MTLTQIFTPARSFDAALDRLAERVVAFGFDAVDYAYMPRLRRADGGWCAPSVVDRQMPRGWQRGWSRYGSLDPYLRTCAQRTLPLDWSEVHGAAWLAPVQRDAIAYLADLGFPHGITVPLHLPDGAFAFISAMLGRDDAASRSVRAAAQGELLVLAHSFQAFVAECFPEHCPQAGNVRAWRLTAREAECLNRAAAGYSAPETAAVLSRSTETIRFHLKNAMTKLGARTIAEATSRAALAGLIEPPAAGPTQCAAAPPKSYPIR